MKTVALDLSRLALSPVRRAPRGIDRVELAYAEYFLRQWPGDCFPVLPTPWGVRCFERRQGISFIESVQRIWRESVASASDPVFMSTAAFLAGEHGIGRASRRGASATVIEQIRRSLALISENGIPIGISVERHLPPGSIYLNVGQLQIHRSPLKWLGRRADVNCVLMIHDLIPLQYPEHHLKIGIRLHEAIIKNTAAFADAVIVPSFAVLEDVRLEFLPFGRLGLPIHVEHLAVGADFVQPTGHEENLISSPYFIVCGVLDSYKNHMLLLRIWRRLVAQFGATAPKLIIAGSPGVTSQHLLWFMAHYKDLEEHVMLSSGLATSSLVRLITNARALLMPSLAEGFGLPIVEALALGTAVIASDIPAHREAGRDSDVTFLPATDEQRWMAQIEQLSRSSEPPNWARAGHRPKTWPVYFKGISGFLTNLPVPLPRPERRIP